MPKLVFSTLPAQLSPLTLSYEVLGFPRLHSRLSEYNPTHPKNPLYFPLNKHFIAFWC